MKGTLQKISNRPIMVKGRQMKAFDLVIDGELYSSLSTNDCESLKDGDKVVFEFKVNGEFKNLTKIMAIDSSDMPSESVQTKITDAPVPKTDDYWKGRNLEIRFQGLGKIAVDLVLKAHEKDKDFDIKKGAEEVGVAIQTLDAELIKYLRSKEPVEAMI